MGVFREVPTDKVVCDADSDLLHPVQVEADGLTLDTSPTDSVPGPKGSQGHLRLVS